MARRLATTGYYIMLPNMYYRAGVMELGPLDPTPDSPWRTQMFALMSSLTIPLVMADTDALIAYADADPAARGGKIGAFGYCMSGQYAISAAARYPDRVAAAASIYGVQLVTDAPDSPHIAARNANAEIYVACAETDSYAPPEMIAKLEASFKADGVNGEVEWYPGTHHGFAFPQRAVYDKPAAERHWERLHALFGRCV
jgi:carboxymethylenebutenolidase